MFGHQEDENSELQRGTTTSRRYDAGERDAALKYGGPTRSNHLQIEAAHVHHFNSI